MRESLGEEVVRRNGVFESLGIVADWVEALGFRADEGEKFRVVLERVKT